MTTVMGRSSDVALSTDVAPLAGVLAAPFPPLAAPLEALAAMLQAVTPMLQAVPFPLPPLPSMLVAPPLQPLAVPLPAPPLMLHPISLPLQPLAATLEPPASVPGMPLVAGVPAVRVLLGTLDGKGVGRTDLGRQRRHREAQRGREGERQAKAYHAFLLAAGPRGSEWNGAGSNGRETTKWSGR
jgi:hypothetical protein